MARDHLPKKLFAETEVADTHKLSPSSESPGSQKRQKRGGVQGLCGDCRMDTALRLTVSLGMTKHAISHGCCEGVYVLGQARTGQTSVSRFCVVLDLWMDVWTTDLSCNAPSCMQVSFINIWSNGAESCEPAQRAQPGLAYDHYIDGGDSGCSHSLWSSSVRLPYRANEVLSLHSNAACDVEVIPR